MTVVATNGSISAQAAVIYAAEWTARAGGRLRIVHVMPVIEYRVGRGAPMVPRAAQALDPSASPVLCSARELAWQYGCAPTLALLTGDTARMIVAAASGAHADLIMLSAPRPRGRFARPRTVRRWVEHHAPCAGATPHRELPRSFPSDWLEPPQ